MSVRQDEDRWKPPIRLYAIVPASARVEDALEGASRLGTIATGRFAAVVGDGPRVGNLGQTREELARQLLSHQRAIEQLMQATVLLPVKFGTLVPDEASVSAILERGQPAFDAAFSQLDGCVQLEVQVKWDLEAVFGEIAAEQAVACAKRKLEQEGGAVDAASRAALGRLVAQALGRRRAVLAETLAEALRPLAVDTIAYPVSADQMVLNLVLLVRTQEMVTVERCLEALDVAHDSRLTFRCVGPSAPFSFATVEVECLDATAVARARKLLDVVPAASLGEVRTAYRRLAKSVHPDLAGPRADDGTAMAALAEACRILSLNAEASAGADPHVAGHAVHVRVRRQEPALDVAT